MGIKNKVKKSLRGYKNIVIWGAGGLAKTAIKKWLSKLKVNRAIRVKIDIDPYNFM